MMLQAVPFGPPVPVIAAKAGADGLDIRDPASRSGRVGRHCRAPDGDQIVVCGDPGGGASRFRLPLPDERAPGERVSHPSEAPGGNLATGFCHRPGCAEPSKIMETVGKLIAVVRGEDPPPPRR